MAKTARFTSQVKKVVRTEAISRARRQPIRSGHVLYESNSGRGAVCNPEAIFRQLLREPDMQHLTHIWTLDDLSQASPIVNEFRRNRNVRFVRYRSVQYFEAMARSEYLINNSTFPPELLVRPEQTYVNTWHGTPLKLMGYDVAGGGPDTRNIIRNFVQADYILSPNSFTTQTMLRHAYRLDGIYRGAIIEEGYPRVDEQFLTETERKHTIQQMAGSSERNLDRQKILLIAPTWKGNSFYNPVNDIHELTQLVSDLQAAVGDSWHVALKVHPRVYQNAVTSESLRRHLVPNEIPTNKALGAADALVTDYSSIFYDFQASARPTIFYIPDFDSYSSYRGLYSKPEEWPGPIVTKVGQLAKTVLAIGSGNKLDPLETHRSRLETARATYNSHDDGGTSKRIIDIVFRGNESGHNVLRSFGNDKKSVLIYLGGLLPNGITTSALNLLHSLDYSILDVSVTYPHSSRAAVMDAVSRIPDQVRLFPRIGDFLVPRGKDHVLRKTKFQWGNDPLAHAAQRAFTEEWHRCFGNAQFDHIIDFSGYSPQWAGLLASGPAATRAIWQHNDLAAEVDKVVKGRQPHVDSLPQVFRLYSRFDNIVSVSESLSEINRSNLRRYAPNARFDYARNLIDADRVRQLGLPDLEPGQPIPNSGAPTGAPALADLLGQVIASYGTERVELEVGRLSLIARYVPSDGTNFVTVGRLSPEKNQKRLLEAFASVHREHPSTHLTIVGSGQLAPELESAASALNIREAVTFTGQLSNPYAVMAASSAFVLSSDYEGQPMVILEALSLGVPIVTTRFASVRDALPLGSGIVTDPTPEALAEGLRAVVTNRIDKPTFDSVAYNEMALREFLSAVQAS